MWWTTNTTRLLESFRQQQQQLLALVQQDRLLAAQRDAAVLGMVTKMVEAVSAQSAIFGDYLKMIANVPTPEIRSMSDAEEAQLERIKEQRLTGRGTASVQPFPFEFGQPSVDIESLIADLRQDALVQVPS